MSKKQPVRFVVIHEYNGQQSMNEVFESVVESVIRNKYERWLKQKKVEQSREAC